MKLLNFTFTETSPNFFLCSSYGTRLFTFNQKGYKFSKQKKVWRNSEQFSFQSHCQVETVKKNFPFSYIELLHCQIKIILLFVMYVHRFYNNKSRGHIPQNNQTCFRKWSNCWVQQIISSWLGNSRHFSEEIRNFLFQKSICSSAELLNGLVPNVAPFNI